MKVIKNIVFWFLNMAVAVSLSPFTWAETYSYVRSGSNYAIASEVLNSGGYNGDGSVFSGGRRSVHYVLKDSIGTAIADSPVRTSSGYTITAGCLGNNVNDNDGDNIIDTEEIFNYRTDPDSRDTDNDGFGDIEEINTGASPINPEDTPVDTDLDGIRNYIDSDDDDDGHPDIEDVFILDASEWLDTDRDGIGNNADPDDDNDGYTDIEEVDRGSDPFDANSYPVIYVNCKAVGGRTGISWENAYLTINEAIRDGQYEIWVANGIYKERIYLRDRDVRLYGGFRGRERYRDERDALETKTIISNSSDSMVTIIGATEEAVIDGFIMKSYKSRCAVYLYDASVRLINNTIQQGYHSGYGIYAERDSSIIARNIISGKMQYGIYCDNSSAVIEYNIVDCRYNEGVRVNGGLVLLINNTILGKNGGIILESGNPELYNNIVYSNIYPVRELRIIDPFIYNNNLYTGKIFGPIYVDITRTGPRRLYSISQVNALNNSRNNISVNPKFISSQDLHLKRDSLCIDMGYYMRGARVDIDGQIIPNPDTNLYEIGADEWYEE